MATNRPRPRTSVDLSLTEASILPWDRFFQWVYGICVVTFDLELGQALELIYPSHIRLTEKEKTGICYLAFPDSNSGCMGDTQFHFRVRQCKTAVNRLGLQKAHQDYNKSCQTSLQVDPEYLFGYVYFRQVKDRSIRRGYFQKSVVLLTKLPFFNLFTEIMAILAPQFFDHGEPSIEAAGQNMDRWPSPKPGTTLNLPIVGIVFQVRIPSRLDRPGGSSPTGAFTPTQPTVTRSVITAPTVLQTLHDIDLFGSFIPIISHIQLLWEIVLTAEPLVVMATSPQVCSTLVQALLSLISPLKFCADYRPFFTIHDSEFKEYTTKAQAPPAVILGVTNPFFTKTLNHWPHIIRLNDSSAFLGSGTNPTSIPTGNKHKIKRAESIKTLDSKPGLYTCYKPFLQKDKVVLKKLLKGIQNKRPLEVQNVLLRRFLLELTQSFIIPLERYMASLMPLQKNISPFKGTPIPKPFNQDDFLKTLEQSGPQLTTGIKGDWAGLYRQFFRCTNFAGWFNARYEEVSQKLQALHLEAMSDADLVQYVRDKEEVEVVDLVLRLKDKLAAASREELPISESIVEKLQGHMAGIIETLPDDLRGVLKTS